MRKSPARLHGSALSIISARSASPSRSAAWISIRTNSPAECGSASQQTRGLSVIYITHDLGVVAKVADHVYVMYAGKVVERGTIFDIFYDPRHPYTWGLLSAIPDPKSSGELPSLAGTPPVLDHEITGDAFAPRNPYALEIDFKQEPPEFGISKTHFVRSWLADPRARRHPCRKRWQGGSNP